MQSGVVPPDFKQALVNPLIKNKLCAKNDLKNYRPISNLSFLSKILEKWLLIAFMNIFIIITCQMIYSLHKNDSTLLKRLFSRYTMI